MERLKNVKYTTMMLGDIVAQTFHVCPLLTIITDSDQGKTDTKKIFLRDCETAFEVESVSKAALLSSLGPGKKSTIVLDDPESWDDVDLSEVLSMFKTIATEHLIKPQRETKFSKEAAKLSYAQCIFLLNNDQFEVVYPKMKKSGYYKRSINLFLVQDEETTDYCDTFYEKNEYESENLPYFTDPHILKEVRDKENLKSAYKWIQSNFNGFPSKVMRRYAQLLSDNDFNNLKPYLKTTYRHPALEKIEFEEPQK